jgi:hypothetical protein
LVGVPFEVIVTAQSAGAYKPHPEPYRRAFHALALPAGRVLFVAGSPSSAPTRRELAVRPRLGLAVVLVGQFMILLDRTCDV